MSSLITPSAKAHERISSRWEQDIRADSRRDWTTYYLKQVAGSPVPYLLIVFVLSLSLSRAATEVTAWSVGVLTALYILADRFSGTKEFRFFHLGPDLFLGLFFITGCAAIFLSPEANNTLEALGALRWIPLAFGFAYALELFPGLNRLLSLLFVGVGVACVYALFQHFNGTDFVRAETIELAPLAGRSFYAIRGFHGSIEPFATLVATLISFPVSAFLLCDKRDSFYKRWGALALVGLMALTLLWTYRPGIWLAGGIGLLASAILHKKRHGLLLGCLIVFLGLVIVSFYESPSSFLDQTLKAQSARAATQRTQINHDLELFYESPWIGKGLQSSIAHRETNNGNLYFQILGDTGALGLLFYFGIIIHALLLTYRLWREIPASHFWHHTMMSGLLGAQISFHVAGLYWLTLSDGFTMNWFAFFIGATGYIAHHYASGFVTDDYAL